MKSQIKFKMFSICLAILFCLHSDILLVRAGTATGDSNSPAIQTQNIDDLEEIPSRLTASDFILYVYNPDNQTLIAGQKPWVINFYGRNTRS